MGKSLRRNAILKRCVLSLERKVGKEFEFRVSGGREFQSLPHYIFEKNCLKILIHRREHYKKITSKSFQNAPNQYQNIKQFLNWVGGTAPSQTPPLLGENQLFVLPHYIILVTGLMEPTITRVSSGFSGYILLDIKIVLKDVENMFKIDDVFGCVVFGMW